MSGLIEGLRRFCVAGAGAAALALAAVPARAQPATPVTEQVQGANASDRLLIDALRQLVPLSMRRTGEPGVSIALARHGQLVWAAGFGYADLARREKLTPDHVFHAGSMSKTYVATAVMQLAEQGVVDLDARADTYLPFKVENPLGDRPVTVRDLLTHRSGLSIGDDGESQAETPRPLEAALREAYGRDHLRPYEGTETPTWAAKVGQTWMYSNIGAATLGLIVERSNPEHLSFPDYVQKHIMDPLGMKLSQFPAIQDQAHVRPEVWSHLANGYVRMGGVYIATPKVQIEGYPAGSSLLRPEDHIRLLLAYMNGGELDGRRILKAETVAEMLKPGSDIPGGLKQGLIWRISDAGKPTEAFGHSGEYMFGWVNTGLAWPRLDTAAVISTNEWPVPAAYSTRDLVQRFIGDWAMLEPKIGPSDRTTAWKSSYVAGMIFVEAFHGELGMRTRMTPDQIRALAHGAIYDPAAPGAGAGWDPEGFIAAVEDMRQVHMTKPAITAFEASGKMKVTPEEAFAAYRAMGGMIPGEFAVVPAPKP